MAHSTRFQTLCEHACSQISEITVEQTCSDINEDTVVLLDVREDHEWQKGHLPKAQHIGRGILERDIEKNCPDTGTKIILYCGGGYRSALAALSLQAMGYTNVLSMQGGYKAWLAAGFEIINN